MSDLNNYSFTGRLGADAEVRHASSGTAVWSARVGVGYGYGDKKGTNWITVKAFGKRAEGLEKLGLAKGASIGGSGALQVREYDKKDGSKGTSIEVTVDDVALLGPKPASQDKPARNTPADDFDPDRDLPF